MRTHAYIYALRDPKTLAIRYIGKSVDPNQRFKAHLSGSNGLLADWLELLKNKNQIPVLHILEKTPIDIAEDREQWWINQLVAKGCKLLNLMKMGLPSRSIRWSRYHDNQVQELIEWNPLRLGFIELSNVSQNTICLICHKPFDGNSIYIGFTAGGKRPEAFGPICEGCATE